MAKFRHSKNPKGKYKSRLEEKFAQLATEKGLPFEYEVESFGYVRPAKYWPDWRIRKNVFIETKGYLTSSDRSKLRAFKLQHPNIALFLLFGNSKNRIRRSSDTTYGEWATKHGFPWADMRKGLPVNWWKE